jgi:hypothetical protein
MKDAGKLLHDETFGRQGVGYRIAVYRVPGGLQSEWNCNACRLERTDLVALPSLNDCVASARRAIVEHHRQLHSVPAMSKA